jgi:hypothetical protein
VKKQRTFKVAKYGLKIPPLSGQDTDDEDEVHLESFAIRRMNGEDEIAAIEMASAAAAAGKQPSGAAILDYTIASAIAEVNGVAVPQPFLGWRKWPANVRDFVRTAFTKMNDAPADALKDFVAAEFGT